MRLLQQILWTITTGLILWFGNLLITSLWVLLSAIYCSSSSMSLTFARNLFRKNIQLFAAKIVKSNRFFPRILQKCSLLGSQQTSRRFSHSPKKNDDIDTNLHFSILGMGNPLLDISSTVNDAFLKKLSGQDYRLLLC